MSSRSCRKKSNKGSGTCSRGEEVEDQFCSTNPCPRWNFWTQWTDCSVTCGNGVKTRSRSCEHGEIGQNGCTGDVESEMFCATNIRCPYFTEWSQWSICSQSCLGGTRSRSRECSSPDDMTLECDGEKNEEEPCATGPCPYWAEWGEWGACSNLCGGGDMKRNRECIDGKVGDIGCSSLSLEEYQKQLDNAKANGEVSMRGQYANSFMSSIQANQVAKQIMTPQGEEDSDAQPTQPPQPIQPTPPPLADEDAKHCNTQLCPGEEPKQWAPWGQWAKWSFCSKSCGGGQKYRYRACQAFTSDPENWKRKIIDKNMCKEEDAEELASCNTQSCPTWSSWNQWSVCEAAQCLGKGKQFREKTCVGGNPGDDGCDIKEEYEETRECVFNGCPHPAEWYEWSECSKTCGGGLRFRERPCLNGEPGDKGCEQEKLEERDSCKNQSCPKWSSWTRWTSCDAECGKGHRRTRRICMDGHVGLDGCLGPVEKRKSCFPLCEKGGTCVPDKTCSCDKSLGWTERDERGFCKRNQSCKDCSKNAVCLENGAICKCLPGFSGNGQNCRNIDECTKGTHFCEAPAQCVDTEGSYFCICPRGFRLHQKKDEICVDIDECGEDLADCPEPELWKLAGKNIRDELNLYTSKCKNTLGSYECACNTNYHHVSGSDICQPSAPALIGFGSKKASIEIDACFANIFKSDISWQVPFTARGNPTVQFFKKPTLSIKAELRNVKKEEPKFLFFYLSELLVDEIPLNNEWNMTVGEIEIEDSHISLTTLAPEPMKKSFNILLSNKKCLKTINPFSSNFQHYSIVIGNEKSRNRTELIKMAVNLLSISYASENITQAFLLDIRDFRPDWVKEQKENFAQNIFTSPGKMKFSSFEILFQAKTKNITEEVQELLDFSIPHEDEAFFLTYERESKIGALVGLLFVSVMIILGTVVFTIVSVCERFQENLSQMSLYLDEKSSDAALFYSIKLLARAQGFEEVHKDAVDLLVDLTKLFLNNFGESAKRIREKIARIRKSPLEKEDFMTILDKTVEKIGIVPEKGKGVEGLYDWYREELVTGQEEESEKPGSPIFRDESALWDEIHAEHSIHRIHLEGSPMRKSKKQKIEKKGSVEVEDEFSAELASPLVGDLGQGDSLGAIVNAALVSVESDDCRRVDSLLCTYNEDSSDCLPPPAPF
ncbi:Oidioi.mRNA.OKI2018_I69.chr2.g4510.t1.cds [Oikopleura dioica]|uniref:Oidioi.mRNA.OKI2018_I69.chr2.g4510.t1.cds n=1 Tax=Oikopleura dioica TaxID=34765 RepID=A0ABN7T411_OIKDI|nr:Oidioi.mRNA.OKI2018_I69.chr2.g4510.t1.cds [Oikopleura dioica]